MSEAPTALDLPGPAGDGCRLLAAARRLFAQRGPSVTLSEVMVEAGIDDSVCGSPSQVPPAPGPGVAWIDSVREIVLANLDRPALSLQAVARMLAVSHRTLQRRLAEEGTSWRAVLDDVRRERAAKLLDQGATTDATAERLGYSGSRSLRRALRRWNVDASGPQVDALWPPRRRCTLA